MNSKDLVRTSKKISYALRHAPEEFGLKLSPEGWTPIADLLTALNKRSREPTTLDHIKEGLATASKKRFEIDAEAGLIRAYYGHSVPQKIEKEAIVPPEILYHGTSSTGFQSITKEGLKPMKRHYVHLSGDRKTARVVGRRKGHPIIMLVKAGAAHRAGIKFYARNEDIWLSDPIPASYLAVVER